MRLWTIYKEKITDIMNKLPNIKRIIKGVVNEILEEKNAFPTLLYHGTPHKFDNFLMSKLNTGQHSQDFGKGLYFTTDKETAKFYANQLSHFETLMDKYNACVHSYNDTDGVLTSYIEQNRVISVKRVVNDLIKNGVGNKQEWLNFLNEIDSTKRYGYIYTVEINNPNYITRDEYIQIQRTNNLSDDEMNELLLSRGYNGIIYDMNTKKCSDRDFSGEKNVVIIDENAIHIIDCEKVNFDYIMKIRV